jgi:RNA polymerase sigma factor (sigma-70 family)
MGPVAISDPHLVARCRRGDEEAWHELVNRFSSYVYAIATQAFRLPPHDAEDVFQEVFTRTYERLGTLREDAALRPWIGQLARRICLDRLRASSREHLTDEEIERPETREVLSTLEDALVVHDALRTLPEHCREILDRFFARDESYQTIGAALALPAGTIASRISRCLAKLRRALERKNGRARNVLKT